MPFMAASGLVSGARITYYLLMIPAYFLLAVMPTGLGVIIGMLGMRMLSVRVYSFISSAVPTALGVIVWILAVGFSQMLSRLAPLFRWVSWMLEMELAADIIPPLATSRMLIIAAHGEAAGLWRPGFFLVAVNSLVFLAVLAAARQLFYPGWLGAVPFSDRSPARRRAPAAGEPTVRSWPAWRSIAIMDWVYGLRNTDMRPVALVMAAALLVPAAVVGGGALLAESDLLPATMLMAVAAFYALSAASVLFVPMEISVNRDLIRERYWLLKALRVSASSVLVGKCVAHAVPAAGLGVVAMVLFGILRGMNSVLLAASMAGIAAVVATCTISSVAWEVMLLSWFRDRMGLGNFLSLAFWALVITLTVGPPIALAAYSILEELPLLGLSLMALAGLRSCSFQAPWPR